jgi:hypothetical protein
MPKHVIESALTKAAIGLGNVDNTSDLSKPISTAQQAALDGKAPAVHGHTFADLSGVVSTAQLPPLAISETFVVATQAAMLALNAQRGDVAIRTDTSKTYILATDTPATLADWKEITAPGAVVSVAGKTGTVTLVKADVGLGSVDNTADTAKPVSTAQQTALNAKADKLSATDYEVTDATKGVVLKAPGGARYRLTVGDDGALTTTSI